MKYRIYLGIEKDETPILRSNDMDFYEFIEQLASFFDLGFSAVDYEDNKDFRSVTLAFTD